MHPHRLCLSSVENYLEYRTQANRPRWTVKSDFLDTSVCGASPCLRVLSVLPEPRPKVSMALNLLEEMKTRGVPRDTFSYNAAMHG